MFQIVVAMFWLIGRCAWVLIWLACNLLELSYNLMGWLWRVGMYRYRLARELRALRHTWRIQGDSAELDTALRPAVEQTRLFLMAQPADRPVKIALSMAPSQTWTVSGLAGEATVLLRELLIVSLPVLAGTNGAVKAKLTLELAPAVLRAAQ